MKIIWPLLAAFFIAGSALAQEVQEIPTPDEPQYYFPPCSASWTPPVGITLRGGGLTKEGTRMMFFKSKDGSWGLIEVNRDGMQCLLATGRDWRDFPEAP